MLGWLVIDKPIVGARKSQLGMPHGKDDHKIVKSMLIGESSDRSDRKE